MRNDRILCSAIYIQNENIEMTHSPLNVEKGIVICGRRHCDCLEVISLLPKNIIKGHKQIQGFITKDNYFVNREIAKYIAVNASQCEDDGKSMLFSEDLY